MTPCTWPNPRRLADMSSEVDDGVSPFLRKLRYVDCLTRDDEAVLASLSKPMHAVERGDIALESTEPHSIILVVEGWVCRYKLLENGRRQITTLFLPGDLCEPFGALPHFMDHSLNAITPALLGRVPPQALRDAARASSGVEKALWWDLLLWDAIQREHVVSLGRRSATGRLGHFFCEVHDRLGMVGLLDEHSYDIPLTQADLADLYGLSAVQVNRSLQELRGSGLISLRSRRLTIQNLPALRELAMYDPTYFPPRGAVLATPGLQR